MRLVSRDVSHPRLSDSLIDSTTSYSAGKRCLWQIFLERKAMLGVRKSLSSRSAISVFLTMDSMICWYVKLKRLVFNSFHRHELPPLCIGGYIIPFFNFWGNLWLGGSSGREFGEALLELFSISSGRLLGIRQSLRLSFSSFHQRLISHHFPLFLSL